MLCSKNPSTNFQELVQPLTQQQVAQMQLKYYNSDVHRAAFVLPEFAHKVGGLRGQGLTPPHTYETSFQSGKKQNYIPTVSCSYKTSHDLAPNTSLSTSSTTDYAPCN
ncbi:hypothetical protein H8959_000686 [Pygathrix nigripes]